MARAANAETRSVMVILSDHDFDGEPVQVEILIVSTVSLGTMIQSACVVMQSKCCLINTPLEAHIKETLPFLRQFLC